MFLLQVQATDPDCGVNSMVNYTLAASKIASEQLLVRSDTGEICVKSPLDRESASYLELPVIATDRGQYFSSISSKIIRFLFTAWLNLRVVKENLPLAIKFSKS